MGNKPAKIRVGERREGRLARKAVKLVIVLAAIGALVFVGLGINGSKPAPPPSEAPPVKVAVQTVTAEPQFLDTFELPATVEPNQIVKVSAEVAGQIEWIGPREGALVQAGDLLLRLNTDLVQAELEKTQAQVKYDQSEFERQKGLVEGGAAPDRDLDEAVMKLAVSKAQLDEVRARLARARIAAPFSGVLNDLLVEQGEYVQAGTRVADIIDTSIVKVVVEVPERDVPFFSVGEKAEVCTQVKNCPQAIPGTIRFISELADLRTRSTRMEITVKNTDNLLRSGQIVQVHLTRQVLQDAILIPLQAVIPMEEGKAVYVVESPAGAATGQAQRRDVELGVIKGNRVQIKSGLKSGDRLIVAGHRFVAPGQDVEIIPESK